MVVLVGCEESQVVTQEFRRLGHEAFSCDLQPTSGDHPEWHLEGDVLRALTLKRWDLVIAHPPCTYLSSSGIHWNSRRPERRLLTDEAAEFFMRFTELDCAWAIENPVGVMSTRYRKPDQIIHPYQFGDDASKSTCLWLKKLPPLSHGQRFPGRKVELNGKMYERWSNQSDSGQNRAPESKDRAKERSKTYPGIAKAMAQQWGG